MLRRVALPWMMLFSVLCCLPQGARAQSADDARARAHFLAGSAYFDDGRFDEAAREFQEAFDLSGRPEMLLNLSHAHDKSGHLDQAIADLELLLNRYPKTALRPDVERELAGLRARKQAEDDANAAAQPSDAAASAPVEPASMPPPEPAAQPAAAQPQPSQRSLQVGLPTWIAAGSAVALGGVAVATGIVAHSKYTDLESSCKPSDCPSGNKTKADSGKTLALVSTITTFAAVGAAAAAVTMYFLEVGVPQERSVAVAPVVGPAHVGATARVSF